MGMLINALAVTIGMSKTGGFVVDENDIEFGNPWWFVYAGTSCILVLFAGIMSGLTLGLMSLGLVELEILQRSGTNTEKKQAGCFFFVVKVVKFVFVYCFGCVITSSFM
ncbi:ion channel [Lithospermum erythrorhizon]|uniref:Ion channel n=1 Tax=Lithospermum erythrorhizon TaxID=34254 RepID=A0AAV3PYJ7_LITER